MDLRDEHFPIVLVTKELFFSPKMVALGVFARHFFVFFKYTS